MGTWALELGIASSIAVAFLVGTSAVTSCPEEALVEASCLGRTTSAASYLEQASFEADPYRADPCQVGPYQVDP